MLNPQNYTHLTKKWWFCFLAKYSFSLVGVTNHSLLSPNITSSKNETAYLKAMHNIKKC